MPYFEDTWIVLVLFGAPWFLLSLSCEGFCVFFHVVRDAAWCSVKGAAILDSAFTGGLGGDSTCSSLACLHVIGVLHVVSGGFGVSLGRRGALYHCAGCEVFC